MTVGESQSLTAAPKDSKGNTLAGQTVHWASSNTSVLTVSSATSVSTSSGASITVNAVGQGTATITATSDDASTATTPTITVNQAPVATVVVALSPGSITAVGASQAAATLKDAGGNTLTDRVVTWGSSNSAVATVDGNGVVTGESEGTASITAARRMPNRTSVRIVAFVSVPTKTLFPFDDVPVRGSRPWLSIIANDD